jgi:hypothetical protein
VSKLIVLALLAGAAAYFARSGRNRDALLARAQDAGGKLSDVQRRVGDTVRS